MATSAGVAAVAKSLERLLGWRFEQEEPSTTGTTKVLLFASDDFKSPPQPSLSIYLYRVEMNRTMRPAWAEAAYADGRGHLPLDLHFLLTAWAANAEDEYRILGRAMESLEATPILTGPLLDSLNQSTWQQGESIQLLFDEVPAETVLRVFDLLPAKHKLSITYLARVMRLDTRPVVPDLPVATLVTGLVPSAQP